MMKKITILILLILLALACGPLSLGGEEEEQPPVLSEVEGEVKEEVTTKATKSDQPSPTPEVMPTQSEPSPTPLTEPTIPPSATPVPEEAEEPVPSPAESEAGSLIDNFEDGDFDDRWWSYIEEGSGSFACASDQPGHASAHAVRLTFKLGADGYASCGMDVAPDQWEDAEGLGFLWRADQPGLPLMLSLDMADPTQTNPEAEGITPFQVELQTPGQEWTPLTLAWDDLSKAEWVGEGGADALDAGRVVALYFEVVGEQSGSIWFDDLQLQAAPGAATLPAVSPTPPAEAPVSSESEPIVDKWALWVDGPHLRGANIWQAVVIPELDGTEFKGSGPVGPPYTQAGFNRLAAMGANYVSISGPGLFTEIPPYTVDPSIEANLDNLLAMIAEADMFATIGFRTGPGRSEFSLCCGGDPYFDGYFNDAVWEDQAAQDAWVEMWRYTAERYGDNPIVAGYKLMVEPNAAGVLLDIYEPDEFYAGYAGTLYDWNQFYPRIVAGIREVDPDTPILVGGMGWSGMAWLPYLQPTGDPRTVYVIHQYAPQDLYTHQEPGGVNTYPGVFDTDWDGEADQFDRAWLDNLLSPVDTFVATHGAPVAVDECGLIRWVPNGAEFMDDQMDLFEQRGMNYALWEWQTSWAPFAEETHAFDFRLGPDPDNRTEVENDLMDVITDHWARNTIRPSTLTE